MSTIVLKAVATEVRTKEDHAQDESWSRVSVIAQFTELVNPDSLHDDDRALAESFLTEEYREQFVTCFTKSQMSDTYNPAPEAGEEFYVRFTPYFDETANEYVASFTRGGARRNVNKIAASDAMAAYAARQQAAKEQPAE